MILKYAAESPKLDAMNASRILKSCAKLLEMNDTSRLKQALDMASTVSGDSRIEKARSVFLRKGCKGLEKSHLVAELIKKQAEIE